MFVPLSESQIEFIIYFNFPSVSVCLYVCVCVCMALIVSTIMIGANDNAHYWHQSIIFHSSLCYSIDATLGVVDLKTLESLTPLSPHH